MEQLEGIGGIDHPAWTTAVATVAGYLLLLLSIFGLLFLVPWLLVSAV